MPPFVDAGLGQARQDRDAVGRAGGPLRAAAQHRRRRAERHRRRRARHRRARRGSLGRRPSQGFFAMPFAKPFKAAKWVVKGADWAGRAWPESCARLGPRAKRVWRRLSDRRGQVGRAAPRRARPTPDRSPGDTPASADRVPTVERALTREGELNVSRTVARQLRRGGDRDYIPNQSILDTLGSGARAPDPQGVVGQFIYRSPASFSGRRGQLEVLQHEGTGQIRHVLFRSGR